MNGKRYACVLLIFIFCLISASAVCAAENSTDDIANDNMCVHGHEPNIKSKNMPF